MLKMNWNDIHMRAVMCRVNEPGPGVAAISIPREVFDDLVQLASFAAQFRIGIAAATGYQAKKVDNHWVVTVDNLLKPGITAEGADLVEAVTNANGELGALIPSHLR